MANNNKFFVIAIGGTGMRCLESFVHLCAAGMFDGKEIEILTLDTDSNNGNKERVETLIGLYNKIKLGNGSTAGAANNDTFFSAKLNLYSYFTDYGDAGRNRDSFSSLAFSGLTEENKEDNQDLANLFLNEETVQKFDLSHGYRAQTHLGSMLMYMSIVESARIVNKDKSAAREADKALMEYIEKLSSAASKARVFIFGSVFGGTGASSIPVLPSAFDAALRIEGRSINFSQMKFGSTLLTQYFKFKKPDSSQKDSDKIIADSSLFPINSQAALQFYQGDATVQNNYKCLYHIGWPTTNNVDYSKDYQGPVVTGGKSQKNASHISELLAASAAYDFFNKGDNELQNANVQYLYHGVEEESGVYKFTGNTFVGNDNDNKADVFTKKLGAFFNLAHVILTKNGAAFHKDDANDKTPYGTMSFIQLLCSSSDINEKYGYKGGIQVEEIRQIDEYMRQFAYCFDDDKIQRGWIYQIYDSLSNGSFIFKKEAYENNPLMLNPNKFDPGDIFNDPKHNWDKSGTVFGMGGSRYDHLIKIMREDTSVEPNTVSQNLSTIKEKFLAHLHNAIIKAQKYN